MDCHLAVNIFIIIIIINIVFAAVHWNNVMWSANESFPIVCYYGIIGVL